MYHEGDMNYSAAQVEELGMDNFWKKESELNKAMESFRKKEGLFMSCMLITDINTQDSLLVVSAPQAVVDAISYPKANASIDNIFVLQGIVSRKKQLIPYLTSFLKGLEVEV